MTERRKMIDVARELSTRLNGKAYVSMQRDDVTHEVRRALNQPSARLGSSRARLIDEALADQGVRCIPKLAETRTGDVVRLIRSGTFVGQLVDVILFPSERTDRELAHIVTKLKNRWDWGEGVAA